jgi:hypothetical protein
MQALGVLHALAPVLSRGGDPSSAAQRHTSAFNCNSWTAPAVLGAMARVEADGQVAEVARLRDVVAPALSGIGDAHVWKAVRPACLVVAVAGVLLGHAAAGIVVACMLYGACAITTMARGYAHGARFGSALGRRLDAVRPSLVRERVARRIAGIGAGALYGYGIVHAWHEAPLAAFLLSLALALGYTAAKRQVSPAIVLLVLVAAVAVAQRAFDPAGAP